MEKLCRFNIKTKLCYKSKIFENWWKLTGQGAIVNRVTQRMVFDQDPVLNYVEYFQYFPLLFPRPDTSDISYTHDNNVKQPTRVVTSKQTTSCAVSFNPRQALCWEPHDLVYIFQRGGK